jgi:hypothetical protein
MVIVIGDHWALALVGPWSWRRTRGAEVDWRSDEVEHDVWDLCGLDVLDVVPGKPEPAVSFRLSDGSALAALTDETNYEQWTFRHDDLPVTFVGLS